MSIPQWSITKLHEFEKCPLAAHLRYDRKIPEPERELEEGKEHPLDRGLRVHKSAEDYVKGDSPEFPQEFTKGFKQELQLAKTLFNEGKAEVEGEWAFDANWKPTGWFDSNVWGRVKVDLFINPGEGTGLTVDYKTGKRRWNEVKHGDQMQLYQLLTFLFKPELENVVTELWYVDLGETERVKQMKFTRKQGTQFQERFTERALALTTATEFEPKPSKQACKFCPYGEWGTGHCKVGER